MTIMSFADLTALAPVSQIRTALLIQWLDEGVLSWEEDGVREVFAELCNRLEIPSCDRAGGVMFVDYDFLLHTIKTKYSVLPRKQGVRIA